MNFRSKCAVIATMFSMIAQGSAFAQSSANWVVPIKKDYPSSPVGSNVVYGRIDYDVRFSANTGDNGKAARQSFENFLRKAVINLFGSEDGNYVVTLVVKGRLGTEIARKAVLSFAWKNQNFFFFTKESSITSQISTGGPLLDSFPVTNGNNTLQVGLEIQDAKSIALDTETYNKFSAQVSLLKFDVVQPAVEVAPLLKVPLDVMSSLVNSTGKASLSGDTAMSFTVNNSNYPKRVEFPVRGPQYLGRNMNSSALYNNGLVVGVTFETSPTLLGDFRQGKFQNLDINHVLEKAKVGASGAEVQFENVLTTGANKQVLSDLMSLDQDKFPAGRSPAGVCRKLWDTLQRYFTDRDAPAIYAAYLDKYEYVLDVQGAKAGCVDQFQGTMTNLGIPVAGINISH
jgi:hypothetical protein